MGEASKEFRESDTESAPLTESEAMILLEEYHEWKREKNCKFPAELEDPNTMLERIRNINAQR